MTETENNLDEERDHNKLKYHSTRVYKALVTLNQVIFEANKHGVTAELLGLPETFNAQGAIEKAKKIAGIDWQSEHTKQKDRDYFESVK